MSFGCYLFQPIYNIDVNMIVTEHSMRIDAPISNETIMTGSFSGSFKGYLEGTASYKVGEAPIDEKQVIIHKRI